MPWLIVVITSHNNTYEIGMILYSSRVNLNCYILPLTHKQLETHGCVLSTVATDVLVLKHQAITIHTAD